MQVSLVLPFKFQFSNTTLMVCACVHACVCVRIKHYELLWKMALYKFTFKVIIIIIKNSEVSFIVAIISQKPDTRLYWKSDVCIAGFFLFFLHSKNTITSVSKVVINNINNGWLFTFIQHKSFRRTKTQCTSTRIGWFSKAGLQEWMPYVIFHARSHERS